WDANNFRRALDLLDKQRPGPGEDDLRGFEWHYWDRLSHQELRSARLAGADAQLGHLVFSPDGTHGAAVVVGADQETVQIKVWELATGKELLSVPRAVRSLGRRGGGGGSVPQLSLSQGGKRLAESQVLAPENGVAEARLVVWDVAARKEIHDGRFPAV